MRAHRFIVFLFCSYIACLAAYGQPRLFTVDSGRAGPPLVQFDAVAMADAGGSFMLRDFPLSRNERVDIELERFRIASERTRFVIGTAEGDVPVHVDPDRFAFYRGRVAGHAGSHVFLALGEGAAQGRVEMGPGGGVYELSLSAEEPGAVRVTRWTALVGPSAPLYCQLGAALGGAAGPGEGLQRDQAALTLSGTPAAHARGPEPRLGLRQVEMAIDGDFELFSLFGHEQATFDYMLLVYGAVADLVYRDLNARIDLVFVRVWTTAKDPYGPFGNFPRIPPPYDQAQLLSGTRNDGSGGGAYLCGPLSWVGNAIGFIPNAPGPHVANQDIIIAAHELGHCLGARHTHDVGVDECDDPGTQERRNGIMSYCYYFSGGYANTDMRYHTASQSQIMTCMSTAGGIGRGYALDCNQNGVADAEDIASGFSADLNGSGVPDECEDCNANMVLDDEDIASGTSLDLNANGVPDECEPDCNGNGVPDDLDISNGTSEDLHGNGVPDECEADCNTNGVSDYNEIVADMALDINRNAVLDACENCDGDEFTDLEEIDGAGNVWAVVPDENLIREYHVITGVLVRDSDSAALMGPSDVLITAGARVLVTSTGDDRIVEFDRRGRLVGDLVEAGAGGLSRPGAMAVSPRGTLLAASQGSDEVLEYDLVSGAFLGALVSAGAGGLSEPYGLTFGPRGGLYVTSTDGQSASVLEFDGSTGAFVRVFIHPAGSGGAMRPRDIVFTNSGRTFVMAPENLNTTLAFDAETGALLGSFENGTFGGKLRNPWGLAVGPDLDVYVTSTFNLDAPAGSLFHLTDPRIIRYDALTGNLVRALVQRRDSRLNFPRGFDFLPTAGDCNLNMLPDECDISSGYSMDLNGNGVPDECETCYADCDQSTGAETLDILDFLCFQDAFMVSDRWACECDTMTGPGACDIFDYLCFTDAFMNGCP